MTELREDVAVSVQSATFLVDVDDTLLDNDRIRDDIERYLDSEYGPDARAAYWTIQERRFVELGYRDYLGAVQEWWEAESLEPSLLAVSEYLLEYPFADRLYPRALDVLARLRDVGPTVVLTDGDAVFQPRKVSRAGVGNAVDGTSSSTSTRRRSSTTSSGAIRPRGTCSSTTRCESSPLRSGTGATA